jgi:hypothetical protein
MKTGDSGKVLSHIDEAKNWLDEAKEEYTNSNQARGEMNLNLAQAEVRYAWELSRKQNVIQIDQAEPAKRKRKYLPAAASILILTGLTVGVYCGVRGVKTEAPSLTAKNPTKTVQGPELAVAPVPEKPDADLTVKRGAAVNSQPGVVPNRVQNAAPIQPVRKFVKTPAVKDVRRQVIPKPQKQPIVASVIISKPEIDKAPSQITRTAGSEKQSDSGVGPGGSSFTSPRVSVATLIIDEEALTKEAFYSLRNGK